MLLSVEAGVGKTSLLRRLRDMVPAGMRWLSGAYELWLLPVRLGPLLDFAEALPRSHSYAIHSGAPPRDLQTGLLHPLRDARQPTVPVIDDAQWADDATLNLPGFLARCHDGTRALLVLRYCAPALPRRCAGRRACVARRAGQPAARKHAAPRPSTTVTQCGGRLGPTRGSWRCARGLAGDGGQFLLRERPQAPPRRRPFAFARSTPGDVHQPDRCPAPAKLSVPSGAHARPRRRPRGYGRS